MIQRDSSVKFCDLQYIPYVKIVLIITFLYSARTQSSHFFLCNHHNSLFYQYALFNTFSRIPLNHAESFVETLYCVGHSPLLLLTLGGVMDLILLQIDVARVQHNTCLLAHQINENNASWRYLQLITSLSSCPNTASPPL